MEPSFMRARNTEINYFLLLFTIAAGVMIGNLLSTLVTAKYVEYQAKQAVAEANRLLHINAQAAHIAGQKAQQLSAASQAAKQVAVRSQRANDPIGLKLVSACVEWRRADANISSYTTRTEAARHCNRYDHYIQTGRLQTAQ